jgi:serine/threonine-protein kinase
VPEVFWKAADGSGETIRLLEGGVPRFPNSWTPDGHSLAFVQWGPESTRDIWILDLNRDGEVRPLIRTEFDELSLMFSPDGQWMAYVSTDSGRHEVYVESFPRGKGRWIISTGGGKEPRWSHDGTELFYRNGDAMMVVRIRTRPEFEAGPPRVLFEREMKHGIYDTPAYDVAPDGSEFVMIERPLELAPTQLNVVLDWDEELQRRLPSAPN